MGRSNREPIRDHDVFDAVAHSPVAAQRQLLPLARQQLGTVGGGNHYVDVLEDEDGLLWVGVHFGSRGFGHKTATGFLNIAAGRSFESRARLGGDMSAPPSLLPLHAPSGQDYIAAMTIAGEFAYAGREAVVGRRLVAAFRRIERDLEQEIELLRVQTVIDVLPGTLAQALHV